MRSNGSVYVFAVFAVLVGYFTYQWWFNPSRAVKRRLGEVAAALSAPARESEASRLARLAQLRKYLAADIRVQAGDPPQEIASRETVLAIVGSFRPATDGFDVRFTDTQVFVDAEAAAHAYMRVDLATPDPQSGQPAIDSRDASVGLAKTDGEWVVTTAELMPSPKRP
jgi:SnoaL-like protein